LPYQVKSRSLTVVAPTSVDALKLFEELKRTMGEEVAIRDMDGRNIDPDTLRSMRPDA
jgi:hypothetical protein